MIAALKKVLLSGGHLCSRLGYWQSSVRCILAADSPGSLDAKSRSRLLYALMMCGPDGFGASTLGRLIASESNQTPALDCWLASAAQRMGYLPEAIRLYRQAATTSTPYAEASAAARMALLLEEIAAGEASRRIAEQVDALVLAEDCEVILVSLGEDRLPLFEEWLRHTRRFAKGEVVAAGLDPAAVVELGSRIPGRVLDLCRYFATDGSGKLQACSKHSLWIVRTLLIRHLVSRGHRVLSIDLDAFLMNDVDQMLDEFPSAEIIVQQDFSIPMDVARRLGFILCCGFMYFRPTPATQAFLDRFQDRVVVEMDDQIALNHLVYQSGVSNLTNAEDVISFESLGVRWLCPARSMVSREFTSGSVVRHFQHRGESIAELRVRLGISPPTAD